jgi:hypothetical protein
LPSSPLGLHLSMTHACSHPSLCSFLLSGQIGSLSNWLPVPAELRHVHYGS